MFDAVSKFLIEQYSPDFASWLIGEPVALSELRPSELSLEPIRADALMLLQSADVVGSVSPYSEKKGDYSRSFR
jgi:predicted transposase YdaD